MFRLVGQARRRIWRNELLAQGVNAFSAAWAAFIVLLLAGTQVVDWRLALLMPVSAAAVGVYLAARRMPSPYAVAQVVDRRMDLADSLSTALYFSQGERRPHVTEEIRKCQFERAGQLSRRVEARHAIPYTVPRGMYLLAVLALVGSSLFALRYGLMHRLDLKPPLARIVEQQMGPRPRPNVARDARRTPPSGESPDESGAPGSDPDQNGAAVASPNDTEAGGNRPADPKEEGKPSATDGHKQATDGDQFSEDQEAQAEERPGGKDGGQSGSEERGSKTDQAQQGAKQDAGSGESSSLLSKVKDAFQNLLSRVKPPQSGGHAQQQSSDANSRQGKGQQNGGRQPQPAQNGQSRNGDAQGDSQDSQSGDEAKNAQDPQGKGSGKSDSQQDGKQPGSGIGSQDGDKSIKQAEQLAAMGKITELIGKRSANLTGEATVEVKATSQQLHTPYAQRSAEHTEGGAEIDRDEVPVALQPFVEEYFEQVRKAAPVKK